MHDFLDRNEAASLGSQSPEGIGTSFVAKADSLLFSGASNADLLIFDEPKELGLNGGGGELPDWLSLQEDGQLLEFDISPLTSSPPIEDRPLQGSLTLPEEINSLFDLANKSSGQSEKFEIAEGLVSNARELEEQEGRRAEVAQVKQGKLAQMEKELEAREKAIEFREARLGDWEASLIRTSDKVAKSGLMVKKTGKKLATQLEDLTKREKRVTEILKQIETTQRGVEEEKHTTQGPKGAKDVSSRAQRATRRDKVRSSYKEPQVKRRKS